MYYIYSIRNKVNFKRYVGVTVYPARRFSEHMTRALSNSDNSCPKLSRAVRKYGRESFVLEILFETEDKQLAYDSETLYIKYLGTFDNGYNASLGGEGSDRMVPWNKGTKGLVKPSSTSFTSEMVSGEKHNKSKLTDKQRWEIHYRLQNGESAKSLSKEYGVYESTIYRVRKFIERQ